MCNLDLDRRIARSGVFLAACLLVWLGPGPAQGAPAESDGAFGQALDARKGALIIPANPAHSTLPITIECRAKVFGKDQYNGLLANETKASSTHWE